MADAPMRRDGASTSREELSRLHGKSRVDFTGRVASTSREESRRLHGKSRVDFTGRVASISREDSRRKYDVLRVRVASRKISSEMSNQMSILNISVADISK